jgi:hypothetical protein
MKNKPRITISLFYGSLLALAFSTVFSHSTKSQTANFSGNWKVDSIKNNFGGLISPVAYKIAQTIDSITIEGTLHPAPGVTRTSREKLSLDGKAIVKATGSMKSSFSAKWSGNALVKTSIYINVASNKTFQATETWTISDGRKTLTVARILLNDGEGGHGASNAIYHRE